MAHLKVNIIPGQQIQVEGEAEVVLEILQKYAPTNPLSKTTSTPSLQDIVLKSLAKTEAEWLLVYASFHSSPQFTRHDLLTSYKSTQRYALNHSKNLSFNIKYCLKSNWFNAINPTTYSVSLQGEQHFKEILARQK